MSETFFPVGFDYAQTVMELRERVSYEHIAEFCGYDSKGSVAAIITGMVPSHPAGEALYALYREIYGRKPPMRADQALGSVVPLPAVFIKVNVATTA